MVLLLSTLLLADSPPDHISYGILACGSFHGDEVWAQDGELWYGLFAEDGSFEIRGVELEITRVFDPVLDTDGDGDETGKQVSTSAGGEPVVLLWSSEPVFVRGTVVTACDGTGNLLPDTMIDLSAPGLAHWWLLVNREGVALCNGDVEQPLSPVYPEASEYEENYVRIVWAGDLDGDGRVDLVIDNVPHYNIYKGLELYLSSEAGPGELVKMVAVFTAVGC